MWCSTVKDPDQDLSLAQPMALSPYPSGPAFLRDCGACCAEKSPYRPSILWSTSLLAHSDEYCRNRALDWFRPNEFPSDVTRSGQRSRYINCSGNGVLWTDCPGNRE